MNTQIISRKFIIAIVAILVMSPIIGYGFAVIANKSEVKDSFSEITKIPTKTELKKLILDYSKARNINTSNLKIASLKLYNEGWGLIEVRITDGIEIKRYALISLFSPKQGPVVILGPGEQFPHYNISGGLGVPYNIIDIVNKHEGDTVILNE